MAIKVAIVEDDDEVREGLRVLINGSQGFQCVVACPNGEQAVKSLPANRPDVVLMDIQLPGMSGIQCIEKLRDLAQNTQIMMLTVYEDDDQIFKSLAAGATGYVLKKTPPAQLLEAIRDLHNGGSPMSDRIARKVVEAFHQMGLSSKEIENLSERETEILSYVAKGFADKEIAERLSISSETVRTHLRNTYRKLHVRSRTEAMAKYLGR